MFSPGVFHPVASLTEVSHDTWPFWLKPWCVAPTRLKGLGFVHICIYIYPKGVEISLNTTTDLHIPSPRGRDTYPEEFKAQKNTNIKDYCLEKVFDVLPAVPRPQGHLPPLISEGFGPVCSTIRDPRNIRLCDIPLCVFCLLAITPPFSIYLKASPRRHRALRV